MKETGGFQSKLSAAHLYRENDPVFRNRFVAFLPSGKLVCMSLTGSYGLLVFILE